MRDHGAPVHGRERVVSKNSNDAIGECASRPLDDARWLVSRYTSLQCPHRFSLFSCCSRYSPGGSTAISWTRSSISRKRTPCFRSAWVGGAFVSPMPSAVDSPEKRTLLDLRS